MDKNIDVDSAVNNLRNKLGDYKAKVNEDKIKIEYLTRVAKE